MNHTNQRNTHDHLRMISFYRLQNVALYRLLGNDWRKAKYHITRQSAQTPAFTSKHGLLLSIVKMRRLLPVRPTLLRYWLHSPRRLRSTTCQSSTHLLCSSFFLLIPTSIESTNLLYTFMLFYWCHNLEGLHLTTRRTIGLTY